MDVWTEVRDERLDLANFLESLEEEQWDHPTLCEAWRVRHVIGHMIASIESRPLSLLAGAARSGFNPARYNEREGLRRGAEEPKLLLDHFRTLAPSRHHPPGLGAKVMLLDVVTHQQDIRRPMGAPRTIPEARLRLVLDAVKVRGYPFHAKKRIAGLRLRATDIDWATGDGAEVRGSGEALLMVMAARPSAVDDLEGEGKPILASRF